MITEVKNIFYENLLTLEECELLEKNALFYAQQPNIENTDAKNDLVDAFGIYMPFKAFNISRFSIVERLEHRLSEHYPQKLKYYVSFIRLYYNNSYLAMHNDKERYDITVSINVGGLETWPIKISKLLVPNIDFNEIKMEDKTPTVIHKLEENHDTFLTPRGSGVACYARRTPHWREKLICNENEYVAQLFMHWSFA